MTTTTTPQKATFVKPAWVEIESLMHFKSNPKTNKNKMRTYTLSLLPSNQAGEGINTCPHASEICKALCLAFTGHGKFNNVMQARKNRTTNFWYYKRRFLTQLNNEIKRANELASKRGTKYAIRLNTLSDIDFIYLFKKHLKIDIISTYTSVWFYDYTPNLERALRYQKEYLNKANRYHLTFSQKEDNLHKVDKAIKAGLNVSIIFDKLPKVYKGAKVLDGVSDDSKMIFNDGVILGLEFKGSKASLARAIKSGFALQV